MLWSSLFISEGLALLDHFLEVFIGIKLWLHVNLRVVNLVHFRSTSKILSCNLWIKLTLVWMSGDSLDYIVDEEDHNSGQDSGKSSKHDEIG